MGHDGPPSKAVLHGYDATNAAAAESCKSGACEGYTEQRFCVIGEVRMDIVRLDRYDTAILRALQRDARLTWLQLGEAVNLSATACQRRVRTLRQKGIIKRFTVTLDMAKLGHQIHAFVFVNVDRKQVELAEQFRRKMNDYPEVQACHMLSGSVDFILDVVAPDIKSYGKFLEEKILSLAGVRDASSAIVLETVKEPQTMIP
jgi:Lrp/AsnC family transcriptional regulator, leucine-responsive regulatory protein